MVLCIEEAVHYLAGLKPKEDSSFAALLSQKCAHTSTDAQGCEE
jgi:hypothetical protein